MSKFKKSNRKIKTMLAILIPVGLVTVALGTVLSITACSKNNYKLDAERTTLDEEHQSTTISATNKSKAVNANKWTISPIVSNFKGINFSGSDNNHQATLSVNYSVYQNTTADQDFDIVADFGNNHTVKITITVAKYVVINMPWEEAKQYFDITSNTINGFKTDQHQEYAFMKAALDGGYNGLVIGNEITSIGNYAFAGCAAFVSSSGITKIEMPLVTSIGNGAFDGCANLEAVSLSTTASISIGYSSFTNCPRLTLPTTGGLTISSIGEDAFDGCRV